VGRKSRTWGIFAISGTNAMIMEYETGHGVEDEEEPNARAIEWTDS
jgi:hypothetical protein